MRFFTVWLVWNERNVVSVLQDKDQLRDYYSFSSLKAIV